MEARVGARMEVVPPKRWLAPADVGLLALLLAASAGVHAWLVAHTYVTARDSIGFARLALNLESPAAGAPAPPEGAPPRNFIDVLRTAEHPPGYPVSVLAISRAVRPLYPAALPKQMLLSCQLAAAAAGVLLAVPAYLLGRSLFGRLAGFAGALLFQVLPVPARVTSDGLAEALYLLCVTTALFLGTRAVRHRSTLYFLLCGAATGASYLVRPEGVMVVLAVGAVVAGLGILGRWPRDAAVGRLAALAVGLVLVAAPYMVLIGGMSNKPTGRAVLERLLGTNNPRAKLGAWDQSDARSRPAGVLFASWYESDRGTDKPLWAAKETAKEVWKAAHYVPCALAVVGLGVLRRRLFAEPELAVLPLLAIINLSVLYVLGLKIGYVSERHTLAVVLVVCYLAAVALGPIARALGPASGGRFGAAVLLAALVASALPSTLRPLHENRVGHYHAGVYLRDAATPADVVVDPFNWALFFAERSLYDIPPDPADARVVYAVWENGTPHSRLPRREDALNVARDGWSEVVFQWPPDVPAARAKVLVYKLDGGSQDAVRAAAGGAVTPFLVRPGDRHPRP